MDQRSGKEFVSGSATPVVEHDLKILHELSSSSCDTETSTCRCNLWRRVMQPHLIAPFSRKRKGGYSMDKRPVGQNHIAFVPAELGTGAAALETKTTRQEREEAPRLD